MSPLLSPSEELHDIVIVGGGICGLATGLALHRKGISSLVLEKSNKLRAEGAAIGMFRNAWHALDQLGVGMLLRSKAIAISEIKDIWLHNNSTGVLPFREEEFRCFMRSDLIEALAEDLPKGSIRFGCNIVAMDKNPQPSFHTLYFEDGSIIKAKVLIGCDGLNSVVANSLGVGPPKLLPNYIIRGLTNYPKGHNFGNNFLRVWGKDMSAGRIPIDDKLVHWFIDWVSPSEDLELWKDPKRMRDLTIEKIVNYPSDVVEMVECCDLDSLNLSHIRYRPPWHLLFANFRDGTSTIAGDAMHVMGPFLGQGGASSLEDAVVLGRCLAGALNVGSEGKLGDEVMQKRVEAALDKYVKERKLRVLRLSTQSYLIGLMVASSKVMRAIIFALLMVLFGGLSLSHTRYDCGQL